MMFPLAEWVALSWLSPHLQSEPHRGMKTVLYTSQRPFNGDCLGRDTWAIISPVLFTCCREHLDWPSRHRGSLVWEKVLGRIRTRCHLNKYRQAFPIQFRSDTSAPPPHPISFPWTHLLRGVDDTCVVTELQRANHRCSYCQHQLEGYLLQRDRRESVRNHLSSKSWRYLELTG